MNVTKFPRVDITNKKFKRLTAISFLRFSKNGAYWNFKCDCGSEKAIRSDVVVNGKVVSCGCYRTSVILKSTRKYKGKVHPNWQEKPSYSAIHLWLRRSVVKSGICKFCKKEDLKTQFALKHDKEYERKKSNFIELCVPCHRAYDKQARKKRGGNARDWSTSVYNPKRYVKNK